MQHVSARRSKRRPAADPSVAVGYIRLSKDEGGLSPEVQRAQIERWAAARCRRLVAIHQDLGVSGARAPDQRPGLVAALADLRVHQAGVLVAVHRDRFARDIYVAVQIEQLVRELGGRVVTVDGVGEEGDDPDDLMRRQLADVFAGAERLRTRVRTRHALALRRAQGRAIGPHAPYGLRREGDFLVPDLSERLAAQRAADLLRAGQSLRKIGRSLTEEGFRPRGRAWHPEAVRRLLEAFELSEQAA